MEVGAIVAGRFALECRAGEGGMGTVWRALDRVTGRAVALKTLRVDGPREADRFALEASLLGQLSHPAVVRYVAHGLTPDRELFLAMEWLEGEDLATHLLRGPLGLREGVALVRALAHGLAEAHALGIVHRDIKPANVFLVDGRTDQPRLLDFGVARLRDSVSGLTRTGEMVGTPGYMAPEQARGDRGIDARADVFALGCVLYEALTGQEAFPGDTVMAVLSKLLATDVPRVRDVRPEAPPPLDALVARMLARDPAARPTDAREVYTALGAIALPAEDDAAGGARATRGSLAGDARAPRPGAALTTGERHLWSVVMVQPRFGPAPAARDTDRPGPVHPRGAPALPEALRRPAARLEPDDAALVTALAEYGGRCEPLGGRAMLVVVEGESIATDQAARAARCALAARALRPGDAIAVATGRVEPGRGRGLRGEAIERAAQLVAARPADDDTAVTAPPIRIDRVTAALLGGRFELARARDGAAVLLGERDAASTPGASRAASLAALDARPDTPAGSERRAPHGVITMPGATPFVGRDRELAQLAGMFEECASEPVARVVLLTAPPGVGKSRLAQEFVARVATQAAPDAAVWTGHGDPISAGSPYALLAHALRAAAGVSATAGDTPAAEARLAAWVSRHVAPEERQRVAEFLGELIGVRFADDERVALRAARADPLLMGDHVRRAVYDVFAAETAARPVVLVLEDLHWGDLPTVTLVHELLRKLRERPLFVLALARPDVHDLFPRLWADRDVLRVALPPLTRRASERLAREVLEGLGALAPGADARPGGARVDEATIARLVERAAGNAFFLEQLLRAVAADARGERDAGAAAAGPDALPDTVLAVVSARLAALEPDARRTLRAASVFGESFWQRGVAELLGDDARVPIWLAELERQDLVQRRPQARFPGEQEYAFRQGLIREAAYDTLTDADRALGHLLAGMWLESVGEGDAVALGEHFERGRAPDRAARWFARAATDSLEGNDFAGAIARAARGVALVGSVAPRRDALDRGGDGDGDDTAEVPPAPEHAELLAELHMVCAEAHRWRAEWTHSGAQAERALAYLPAGHPLWCTAAAAAGAARGFLSDVPGMLAHGRALARVAPAQRGRAWTTAALRMLSHLYFRGQLIDAELLYSEAEPLALALAPEHPKIAAFYHHVAALRARQSRDEAAYLAHVTAAAERHEAAGDLRGACVEYANVAGGFTDLGLPERAVPILEHAIATADGGGLPYAAALARQGLGHALLRMGRAAAALEVARAAADAFRAQHSALQEGEARCTVARALLALDAPADAAAEARGAEALIGPGSALRAHALALHAQALLAQAGRASEARAVAEEAIAMLECSPEQVSASDALARLVYAEALWASGQRDAARAAIDAAHHRLVERAELIADVSLRATFLANIPEHARTLELARAWLAAPPAPR